MEFLQLGDFEITRDVGSDAALLLRFQRQVILLLLKMSVLGCVVLLPIHGYGGDALSRDDAVPSSPLRWTSIHNSPEGCHWVLFCDVLMLYIFSLLVFQFIRNYQLIIKPKFTRTDAMTAAQACSATITRLANVMTGNAGDEACQTVALHDFMQCLYGSRSVTCCVVVPQLDKLLRLEQKRAVLDLRQKYLQSLPHSHDSTNPHPWNQKLRKVKAEIAAIDGKMTVERQRPPVQTGLAFVTFVRPETQKQFLVDFGPGGNRCFSKYQGDGHYAYLAEKLDINRWQVEQAPDHNDIRWENLHVGPRELLVRSLIINTFLFAFLFFFTTPIQLFNMFETVKEEVNATYNLSVANDTAAMNNRTLNITVPKIAPTLIEEVTLE
eukprot:SAG31_NODE_6683_length_1925_cov_1.941402_3_plen_379_part_01